MKKIIFVILMTVVVVCSLVPCVAAETGAEVAYFSNAEYQFDDLYNSTQFNVYVPGALGDTVPVSYRLTPGAYYFLNGTPFVADSNGYIPDGTVFTTTSEIFIVRHSLDDFGQVYYQLYNGRTGVLYVPNRYRAWSINEGTGMEDTSYDEGFRNGYLSGYNIGYQTGEAIGYDDGYNIGNAEGYSKGKQEGYQEGLATAENGEWTDLFTAVVEAPVNVLYGMFNFELLGLNMQSAIGAILTLCVVIIVIKVVV